MSGIKISGIYCDDVELPGATDCRSRISKSYPEVARL